MYNERHRADSQMRDDSVFAQQRKIIRMLEEIQAELRFVRRQVCKEDV